MRKGLISPFQVSFVHGRQSNNNVILCQEFVHSFRYTKHKRGALILKIDLKKVYDRLEWVFIEETFLDARIPNYLIRMIIRMVAFSSCRLLWNSDVTNEFKQSRGLRQGCPFSPYLFVLCMERLGQWLSCRITEGRLREIRASRQGPGLSHMFFADDLLIFTEARDDQLACIKEILDQFCKCSGQRVNFHKSFMFYSPNILTLEAERLSVNLRILLKKKIGK